MKNAQIDRWEVAGKFIQNGADLLSEINGRTDKIEEAVSHAQKLYIGGKRAGIGDTASPETLLTIAPSLRDLRDFLNRAIAKIESLQAD